MIEKLKELAEKKSFTAEEKAYIKQASIEMNLEFNQKKGCSNCWIDQVMKLYNASRSAGLVQNAENSEANYILKPHIDAVLHGERYNNATLTDKKAEFLISLGFSKWFLKIKSEDESNTGNEVA